MFQIYFHLWIILSVSFIIYLFRRPWTSCCRGAAVGYHTHWRWKQCEWGQQWCQLLLLPCAYCTWVCDTRGGEHHHHHSLPAGSHSDPAACDFRSLSSHCTGARAGSFPAGSGDVLLRIQLLCTHTAWPCAAHTHTHDTAQVLVQRTATQCHRHPQQHLHIPLLTRSPCHQHCFYLPVQRTEYVTFH